MATYGLVRIGLGPRVYEIGQFRHIDGSPRYALLRIGVADDHLIEYLDIDEDTIRMLLKSTNKDRQAWLRAYMTLREDKLL